MFGPRTTGGGGGGGGGGGEGDGLGSLCFCLSTILVWMCSLTGDGLLGLLSTKRTTPEGDRCLTTDGLRILSLSLSLSTTLIRECS